MRYVRKTCTSVNKVRPTFALIHGYPDTVDLLPETLIVWTEPDGTDYALSFQDLEGCAEIWDFILEVQKHFRGKTDPNNVTNGSGSSGGPSSSPMSFRGRPITANTIVQAGRLPEPTLGIIGEIDKAIKFIGRTAPGREKICEYLVREDYIKALIDTFAQAEDLEALVDLHALCGLMQTICEFNICLHSLQSLMR